MNGKDATPASFTTNARDQAEASKLKARLRKSASTTQTRPSDVNDGFPAVTIADGAHKYVLITAIDPSKDETCHFVTSRKGAHYHRNAAEPVIFQLEKQGYRNIEIRGGGRISVDHETKQIAIFGFSYSFGQANHAQSRKVIMSDDRYRDWDVTVSNEGY